VYYLKDYQQDKIRVGTQDLIYFFMDQKAALFITQFHLVA